MLRNRNCCTSLFSQRSTVTVLGKTDLPVNAESTTGVAAEIEAPTQAIDQDIPVSSERKRVSLFSMYDGDDQTGSVKSLPDNEWRQNQNMCYVSTMRLLCKIKRVFIWTQFSHAYSMRAKRSKLLLGNALLHLMLDTVFPFLRASLSKEIFQRKRVYGSL